MASAKVLPQNTDAEASVLASILVDKDSIIEVVEILFPTHFYDDRNRLIYEAMVALYERGEPIDLITVPAELKKQGNSSKTGGRTYLSEIIETVATSAHIEKYARLVRESATKRKLIVVASSITDQAYSDTGDIRQILDKTEADIFSVSQGELKSNFILIKDALAESFDRIDEVHRRGEGMRGIPTGFKSIDNKLAGLQPANMIVLAARPGQGKTAFCLNLAQYITTVQKIPVGFFSLEMSKEELVDRLLVAQADIDAWRLKTGRLTDDDFQKISDAMGVLADAPLYIDDKPGASVLEIRTKARRLQHEHGAKMFIVDYLQLIDSGRHYESRVNEVSMISQAMKNIARELRVPMLVISQLSRAVEHRGGDKRPQLADLRESGAIEQDADIVAFLYRPQEDESGVANQSIVKFLIAKHRNGAVGELDLIFKGDRMRFYEMEKGRNE
ncbi:MAG: replicative DNA helicase [Microgenomates group bacterium GW2011_GWC1_41_8]|uniref:Replicative DNA helicase n=2 Tax=Candidatus Roizmaniibacteriota TaxID=1752723 RepID=A0A0G0TBD9_9BACT|nr:MAG: replicative DNA helicase [Candidatus Roizmanbacteria bacterium GW2011_GWB1_40_7]KKR94324.1 MAG: replicative DNA helicase [Candidatus Roizmanbacteria bacterium GW2011_GWA1_41_13]KKS23535.1 MAG: replicative DNA helicase [Microgenomates group bacterium GW2011_GWC1_41_8]OGK50280.1 MAG: replicative DNA helicase [Candidatus Roizmanbacteria bacterium RIFCSPLOWO2_01_FULL_40_14]